MLAFSQRLNDVKSQLQTSMNHQSVAKILPPTKSGNGCAASGIGPSDIDLLGDLNRVIDFDTR